MYRDDFFIFTNNFGADTLTDSDGVDTLDCSAITTAVTIDLTLASNQVNTGGGNTVSIAAGSIIEIFKGGTGNDAITGNSASNTLDGGLGNDVLNGGDGDDLFTEASTNGADTINGGLGLDKVNYDDNTGATSITYNVDAGTVIRNGQIDSLLNIESVVGTDTAGDSFTAAAATGALNINLTTGVISGLSNGLVSLTQFENAVTGSGNDMITGNAFINNLSGGAGNDTLSSGANSDTLTGGAGNDSLDGGADNDIYMFATAFGTDTIADASGTDTIDMKLFGTAVTVNLAGGIASADGGASSVTGLTVMETVLTGNGADTVSGNATHNTLDTGGGNDTASGGSGNDTITGGTGNDTLNGDDGNDLFKETNGNGVDIINGGLGIDTVNYDDNTTANLLTLNADLGTVLWNAQTDTLTGIESVTATDSTGDIFIATADSDGMSVNLASGSVTGVASGINTISQFEHVTGGSGSDSLTGDASANTLIGGTGNDTLTGNAGNDTLQGGAGDDVYTGYQGDHGMDVIDDLSGTADVLNLSSFTPLMANWSAQDGADGDAFMDRLLIDFGGGLTLTILNYFNNSSTSADASGAGTGHIENIMFASGVTIDLSDVKDLIP